MKELVRTSPTLKILIFRILPVDDNKQSDAVCAHWSHRMVLQLIIHNCRADNKNCTVAVAFAKLIFLCTHVFLSLVF